MRGDSIRDLYAKGLALVGLGLLAVAGALVDYWPTRNALPVPPSQLRLDFARAKPVPADWSNQTSPLSEPRTARLSIASTAAAPMPSIRVRDSVPSDTLGEPVALLTPPVAETVAPVAILALAAAPAAAISGGALLILPPTATPVITTVAWSAEAGDDGFFLTGALKHTGASILKTSARTGASIVDAFRTLGSTMRRALPN